MRLLFRGLITQIHVIQALIIRDTQTRFGRDGLGYLWAFAEPMMWIGILIAAFYFGKRTIPNGMDPVGFIATGLLPFLMFRTTLNRAMSAVGSNRSLLYFPLIRPLDLIFARSIIESVTLALVFVILLIANTLYLETLPLDDSLKIVMGLILTGLLGGSMGLLLGSLAVLVPALKHMVSPVLRPMLWISGVFFTAAELPANIRNIMLWNPLLHLTESTRDGWFKSFDSPFFSYSYVAVFIIVSLFFGLTLERVARRRLDIWT